MATKSKALIATIDCSLITIEVGGEEFGFDTANRISVEPQFEDEEAVKLIIKGVLRAQKLGKKVLTGNVITLSDNVFNPELVVVLQGGSIVYDTEAPKKITGYEPPALGSTDSGETFVVNAYSAQYNAAGQVVQYEKISYPNCMGEPIALSSEDGVFRAPVYTINSAPDTGEKPYTLSYVSALPTLAES